MSSDRPSASQPESAQQSSNASQSQRSQDQSRLKSFSQGTTNPNSSRVSIGPSSSSSKSAERQSLLNQIQKIQSENYQLEKELQAERNGMRMDQSNKRRKLANQTDQSNLISTWQNQIENAMQGLGDDQLLSLLTAPISSILEPLNITTASTEPLPLPDPPVSAGVEHTGSALEVDALLERQKRLEDNLSKNSDYSVSRGIKRSREEAERAEKQREIWKIWGEGRLERGKELLSKLSDYTSVTIDSVQSKPISSSSSLIRRVEMKGSLLHFGAFVADFEVVEAEPSHSSTGDSEVPLGSSGTRIGPKMRKLHVDLPETARKALEVERHLQYLLSTSSLPSIFISLRTLHTSAIRRRKLFSILKNSFGSLTSAFSKSLESRGGSLAQLRVNEPQRSKAGGPTQDQDSTPSAIGSSSVRFNLSPKEVVALYDPELADRLEFRNQSGTSLTLHFRIKFDRFGHAQDELSLKADVKDEGALSPSAIKTLRSLPHNFQRLIQQPPLVPAHLVTPHAGKRAAEPSSEETNLVPLPIERICIATVSAFFGVEPQ